MTHKDDNLFSGVNSKEKNVKCDVNFGNVCVYSSFLIDYLKILKIGV